MICRRKHGLRTDIALAGNARPFASPDLAVCRLHKPRKNHHSRDGILRLARLFCKRGAKGDRMDSHYDKSLKAAPKLGRSIVKQAVGKSLARPVIHVDLTLTSAALALSDER